jgi:mRNA interferase MazF
MHRGEVWLVNLDPTQGAEIQKIRPAVIVSTDLMGKLPLRIIVPVTEWKERYASAPWMLKVDPDSNNGLEKTSSIDCFQVRSISGKRFTRRLGCLPGQQMEEIVRRIMLVLTA